MKRNQLLALMVTLLMALSLTPAMAEEGGVEGLPKELTIWSELGGWLVKAGNDIHASIAYEELERVTGTKINWIHPPAGTGAAEQFNLMIVSGDLPDIINYGWMTITGGIQKYVDDGVIVDMTPYYDNGDMPYIKQLFVDLPKIEKQVRQDNGSIYYMTSVRKDDELRIWNGPQIRVDWLEKVGMPIPDTTDDLYNVLKAFKEQNVSDAANFVPMMAGKFRADTSQGLGQLLFSFNTTYDFLTDPTGTIAKYGPIEPEFKEGIAYIRKLVEEGLVDPNYVTNNRDIIDAAMIADEAGFMFNTQVTKLALLFEERGIESPLKPIPYLRGPNPTSDLAPVFYSEAGANVMGGCLAVTTAAKDPLGAIKWVDFNYSPTGELIRNYGVEGVSYNYVDGEPILTEIVTNNPQYDINTASAIYTPAKVSVFAGIQRYASWKQSTHPDGVDCVVQYMSRVDQSMIMPPTSMTGDEQAEYASIMNDILTYFDETIDRIILGQLPLEHLDTMVDQMKAMGVTRAIELKQAALDRYNAR
ncbi:MAG: extracellular solute-binding protein [Oscillospiraceae bacterium]|jgi:putative aldouronate transport system substrate-binding protein|nr:extracellular solute-binding protein [Oscillospiraceae bacterium]